MKNYLGVIALLAPAVLCAQKNEFAIQGKVGNIDAPAMVYLSYSDGEKRLLDSSAVKDGAFEFKGPIGEPNSNAFLLMNYQGAGMRGKMIHRLPLYLEAAKIKVNSGDSLSTAKISGSKINDDNAELQAALKSSKAKMDAFMAAYLALPKDKQQDPAVRAPLDIQYKAIEEEQRVAYTGFMKSHSNSIVSLDALKKWGGSSPDYAVVAPLFASFSKSVRNSTAGKEYADNLAKMKATTVGAIAPDFTQKDTSGNLVSTASFRGKYLLVDFWASWCAPCRQENPNLVKAYAKYQAKGFEILGVSLDEERFKKNWLAAIKADKLTWPQVSNLEGFGSEPAKLYVIRAIPQNALIDPSGKIIARNLRGEDLEKKLAELFQP